MIQNVSFRAWNGRYRPAYVGAIPLRILMPLMSAGIFALMTYLVLESGNSAIDKLLAHLGLVVTLCSLVVAYKRYRFLDQEGFDRFEFQARVLKASKDMSV